MKFNSTRSPGKFVSFQEAVFQGLAPDGGLYIPEGDLDLKKEFLSLTKNTSFNDIAYLVTSHLLKDELSPEACRRIVDNAFDFEPKLVPVTDQISVLELFHGPSCAFKDFGASFLAAAMEELLQGSNRRALILTATSGDTGSAVAQAFHNKKNIDVVILYPSGRVSPLQEKQLTTLGGNVHALEVKGSFDDCQKMVKDAFVDPALSQAFPLTSANSISLGRLIPQSFYYIWAFAQLRETLDEELMFCVPSGNFGNLTAGVYAWKWGLPVNGFIAATNANDVVPEYLKTGTFKPRPSVLTLSNAMDVGNPSNFERLETVFQKNLNLLRTLVHGETVTDAETLATMQAVKAASGMLLCPHTAVGYKAAERVVENGMEGDGKIVVLATAHPGKFVEVVQKAVGDSPDLPPALKALERKTKVATLIDPTLAALAGFLNKTFKR